MSAIERFFIVWDLEKGVRVRFLGCPLLRGFFIKEKPVSAGTFKLCLLLGGVRFLGCPLLGGLTVFHIVKSHNDGRRLRLILFYFFYFLYFLTLLPFPLYPSPSNCHSTAPPPPSNYKKVCSQLVVSQPYAYTLVLIRAT